MGEVFLATDTKLGRQVALKFLPESLSADPEARERLLREAQAASKLIHPNIVTIHSIESSDQRDFIVMEYVPGHMLDDYFSEKDRSIDEVLSISLQLAEALQKAHEAGVIHRDLKPGNIMMDADSRPRILDFGLAKIEGAAKLTQTGSTVGTLAYISPEQAQGKEVDPRSDIFSFGVLLYEMITGRAPFAGEHEAALIYSIVNDEPEPMARFKSGVADDLQHIVTRCLAKNSDERYQSVSDLAAELKRVMRVSQRPRPAPVSTVVATRPMSSIFRWMAPALVVLAALWYFGPIGPGPALDNSSKGPIRLAVLPFENLGSPDDEYFADGITEEIIARLASVSGLGVIARTSVMSYKGTEKKIQTIAEELGVDYILEGTIRWQKSKNGDDRVRITPQLVRASDGTHAWAHIYEESMSEVFKVQSDVAKEVVAALNITLLIPERERLAHHGTDDPEAYNYYLKGTEFLNIFMAGQDAGPMKQATQFFASALELDPDFAAAHARAAQSYIELYWHLTYDSSDLAIAREHLARAIMLDPNGAEPLMARGSYYYHDHDYEPALRDLEKASKIQPGNASIWAEIGYVYWRLGDFTGTLELIEKAVELDPRSAALIATEALLWVHLGEYDIAEKKYRRSISLAPQAPSGHWRLAQALLLRDGDLTRAAKVFQDASAIASVSDEFYIRWSKLDYFGRNFDKALARLSSNRNGPPDGKYHIALAKYSLAAGDSAQARIHFDSARIYAESRPEQLTGSGFGYSGLALAYAGLGDRAKALESARKARESHNNAGISWQLFYREANTFVLLDEVDSAIDALTELLSYPGERSRHLLRLDPSWDPLREHPRFKALVEDSDAS